MHILFLSDNFPPEVNAPASRTYEHGRYWAAQGHKVTVITSVPNFPKGKVMAGYKNKLWQKEYRDGMTVIRVWTYISANEGFLKRIADYISFMVSAFLAAFFVRRVDVVIGTSPQFFTCCAAWAVGFIRRRPFVFELRDLWPASIEAVGAVKNKAVLKGLEAVEIFLYRNAALVISVTQSFKDILCERSIDPNKIQVVTNGVDLKAFTPRSKNSDLILKYGLQDKFVVGYIGTLGMAHALETIIDASALIQDQGYNDIAVLIIGAGARTSALQDYAKEKNTRNVYFIESVPKNQIIEYWSILDATIVHLKKDPLFRTVIPSKIFEAFSMGVPLIYGVEGESADIVQAAQAGLLIEPEDSEAMAHAIVKMKNNPIMLQDYAAAGQLAAKQYSREELAQKMLDHLIGLTGKGRERA